LLRDISIVYTNVITGLARFLNTVLVVRTSFRCHKDAHCKRSR